MAGKKLTAIVELKGKLDASVDAMLKKMSDNLKNLKKQTASLGKTKVPTPKIGDLDKTIKNSTQSMTVMGRKLSAIQEGLSFNPASLSLLSDKQQTLGKMIDLNRSKLDALRQKQADFVADGGDIGSDKYEELATEIQKAENALERLNAQQNNFSPKVQHFGAKMGQVSEKTEKVAKAIAPVSTAATAGLGIAVKTAADFEQSMSQVYATMGDEAKDPAVRDALTTLAREQGRATKYSASQVAEAENYMALAGYDVEKMAAAMPQVLSLASAGNMDLATTSDMVTDAMSALGIEVTEQNVKKYADQAAKASSITNTSVEQLGDAILTVGGTATMFKGGTVELNTALGILADNGIKGSEGGTALRNVFQSLTSPTDKAAKMMENFGISAFDTYGDVKELPEMLTDLNNAMAGMNDEQQQELLSTLFNKNDLAAVKALLDNSGDRWDEVSKAIANSDGAAAQMAAEQNNNLNGQLTALSSAFESIAIDIGNAFLPTLKNLVGGVQSAADWFGKLGPEAKNAMANVLVGTAAAAPTLLGISKITGGISKFIDKAGRANTVTGKLAGGLGKVFNRKKSKGIDLPAVPGDGGASTQMSQATSAASAGTSKIGSLFQGLGNGISTAFQGVGTGISTALQGASAAISNLNPVGVASFAVVVGTLSLALVGLAKCRGDVLPFLQGMSDIFTSMVGGVLDAVASSLVKLSDVALVLGQALAATAPFVESLGTAIATIASGLGEGIATIAEGVGGGIARIISAIGPAAPQIAAAIATIITAFSNGAPQIAAAVSTIITACQPIVSDLTSLFETLLTQIGPIIQSIGDLIGDIGTAIQDVLTGVSGVIDSIGGAIQAFFDGISGVIDSVGGAALNAGKGFDLMANGISKITSLNLFDMGASLAAVASGAGSIATHGNGIKDVGDGFVNMATSLASLSGSLSSVQAVMSALPASIAGLVTAIDQVRGIDSAFAPMAANVQSSLSQISAAFTLYLGNVNNIVTQAFSQTPTIVRSAMTSMLVITTTSLTALQAAVTASMQGVIAAFQSAMASAVATVAAGMAAIRGMMSVSIQGPRLAVPHVSVSGSFSLNPPSAPSFSVSYYKEGGILSGAQLFGMMGNTGLVGGEAGPEAVLPLSTLWDRMDTILSNAMKAAVGYRENSGRMINADPAVISPEITPASGGFVVNFAPVINLGTAGESAGSTESSITAALSRAKDDLMDELEDLFRERMERSYA